MDLVKWILLTEIITEKMLIIFASSSTRKQKESYLEQLSERGFVWSNGSAAHIIPDVIRLVQSDVILIINPKMKCVDYILDVMTPTSIMQTA